MIWNIVSSSGNSGPFGLISDPKRILIFFVTERCKCQKFRIIIFGHGNAYTLICLFLIHMLFILMLMQDLCLEFSVPIKQNLFSIVLRL